MIFKNGWSTKRNIIEFSQELIWRTGSTNTYYFKKMKNRWHWGYLAVSGIIYDKHPFATQREARDDAEKFNNMKRGEVDQVLKQMKVN